MGRFYVADRINLRAKSDGGLGCLIAVYGDPDEWQCGIFHLGSLHGSSASRHIWGKRLSSVALLSTGFSEALTVPAKFRREY